MYDSIIEYISWVTSRSRRYLDRNRKLRRTIFLTSISVLILSVCYYVSDYQPFSNPEVARRLSIVTAVSSIVALYAIAICVISVVTSLPAYPDPERIELEKLKAERHAIEERMAATASKNAGEGGRSVLETIHLSLVQLTEYYTLSKNQARGSFLISVAALIFGFATLISGIWLLYLPISEASGVRAVAAVSAIGGLVSQFIGASYFYLYNKTIAQLTYFYDRLVRLQDTMLAVTLCDSITNLEKQADLREVLILALMDGRQEGTRKTNSARSTMPSAPRSSRRSSTPKKGEAPPSPPPPSTPEIGRDEAPKPAPGS